MCRIPGNVTQNSLAAITFEGQVGARLGDWCSVIVLVGGGGYTLLYCIVIEYSTVSTAAAAAANSS